MGTTKEFSLRCGPKTGPELAAHVRWVMVERRSTMANATAPGEAAREHSEFDVNAITYRK